jgi:YD repeat-containing protein
LSCSNTQGIRKTIESSYLMVKNGTEFIRQEMPMNTKIVKYYDQTGINYKSEFIMDDQIRGYNEIVRTEDGRLKSYKSYNTEGRLTKYSEVKEDTQYSYNQNDELIAYTKMIKSKNTVENHDYDSTDKLISISINEFDSLENLIKSKMIHFRNEKPDTIEFKIDYVEFDEFGNWTKRTSQNILEEDKLKVDERQIEYY